MSNLKLPKPSQVVHVVQKKDNMASNVGGTSHMAPAKDPKAAKIMKTGGAMKKPSKVSSKY